MKSFSRVLVTAVFAILALSAAADDYADSKWKEETAKGNSPYHRVSMSDYKVVQNINGQADMRTWGFIHYSYTYHWHQDGKLVSVKITKMNIRSGFEGAKSLRRAGFSDESLLVHEQHHLDINEIYADKFRKTKLPIGFGPDENVAIADLKTKVDAIFTHNLNGAKAMQAKYDKETEHSHNKHQQELWNKLIDNLLRNNDIKYAKNAH